jgi:hypothetical protein
MAGDRIKVAAAGFNGVAITRRRVSCYSTEIVPAAVETIEERERAMNLYIEVLGRDSAGCAE